MKVFSMVTLAALLQMANAFAPTAFAPRASKTAAFLIDPSDVQDLVQHMHDAAQVSILECDAEECSMATGYKTEYDGVWHMQGGLPNPGEGRTLSLLSATDCDTE